MTTRREILLLGLAYLPLARVSTVRSQPVIRIPRIGLLIAETAAGQSRRVEALRAGLSDFGYVEGKNVTIEILSAGGDYNRMIQLAHEFSAKKVDLIVAFGSKAALASRSATTTIPIVIPSLSNPVELGLAKSLSRPGGNVTGGSGLSAEEVYLKRLELLKESVPGISTAAFLMNPVDPRRSKIQGDALRAAANSLKLELVLFEAKTLGEIRLAFANMVKRRVGGLIVQQDTLFMANETEIAAVARNHRIPSVGMQEYCEVGGLLGYGASDTALYRRGAYFVDRILKGTSPGDLPFERATRVELIINLVTARLLGITIPQSVMVRASRVIE
jgi:putative ABC transport system substrate-binding protein